MKKTVLLLLLSSLLLSACNLQIKQQARVDLQDIQYHYFEQVYDDSGYFAEVAVLLRTKKIKEATYYTNGYTTAIERRNLYQEVEQDALQKLAEEYDQEMADQAKLIVAKLPALAMQVDQLLTEKVFSTNSKEWTRLTEKFDKLSSLLWDSPEPLWAIFAYPAQSKKKHGLERMKNLVDEVSALISDIEQDIGLFKDKPEG